MASGETSYSGGAPYPEFIERGRTQVIQMPVYSAGALVAPTAAGSTVTLVDAAGTAVWAATAITVTASIATLSVTTALLPTTQQLGEGYTLVWSLVIAGVTRVFRREAVVARYMVSCPVTQDDVTARHPRLLTDLGAAASVSARLQAVIDAAWGDVLRWLVRGANWPNHIVGSESLYDVTLQRSIELAARRIDDSGPGAGGSIGRYARIAEEANERFKSAQTALTALWDRDQDGTADTMTRSGGSGVTLIRGPVDYSRAQSRPTRW